MNKKITTTGNVSTLVDVKDISNDQVQAIHDLISKFEADNIDKPELHFICVGIIRAINNDHDMELIQGMIDIGFEQGNKLKG